MNRQLKQDKSFPGLKKTATVTKVLTIGVGILVAFCISVHGADLKKEDNNFVGPPAPRELISLQKPIIPLLDSSGIVHDAAGFVAINSTLFYSLSALFGLIAALLLFFIDRASGWSILKVSLNKFSDVVYEERNHNDTPFHRVTLFKHTAWWTPTWFRKNKLIPKVRSGHQFQKSKTYFYVDDIPENCVGVAGKAWGEMDPVIIAKLEDIVSILPTSNKFTETIRQYAAATHTPADWVIKRRDKLFSRSFYAVKIEVNFKPWGVLVLDSKRPEEIQIGDLYKEFPVFLSVMTKVIKDFNL